MKPRPFDYVRPDTVEEAVAILAEHGDDARILAGGQTLLAMLNLRVLEPAILVDITRIPELAVIREIGGGDKIEVGASVTQNQLMAWPALAQKLPLLAAALPFVGHFQTRNKGTVCGSIAHADPTSEIPLSLALLEGEVMLRSPRGTRVLAAADFQQGMLATAREPDELITAVRFPVMSGGVGFREVARRHGDFAIVAVAAVVENAGSVRVGVAGMADRPAVRCIAANGASGIRDAIERLAWELEGYEDVHASARMRRDLLRGIAPVVIEEAKQCAA
jgi:2-furoyl-CoA dehydrogenase FAD binding subunit